MRWGLGGLLRAFFAAPALMFRLAPLEHGHYARSWRRLAALERWLDLAVRPDPAEFPEDADLLEAEMDNLPELRARVERARRELSAALPPMESSQLVVQSSTLGPRAGLGLFAGEDLAQGELVAHYGGDLHSLRSSLKLQDTQYVMRLGCANGSRDEIANACLYVDAGPHLGIKARFINDCRNPRGYNLTLVCCPDQHYAKLLAARDICQGEELFFDYGEKYWEDRAQHMGTDELFECVVLTDDEILNRKQETT
ncbi:unnamed protein product [Effrenium voratum]|uniref:SET domain-containing protein n=1 Tax=Effrenium voratum TaxID=2562239 RepID=A0AA36MMI2_9DINO|nr:unnamed protein product [Effrenium voratum]CAJ1450646.1 unnamed protein product [Effrenium voratum]